MGEGEGGEGRQVPLDAVEGRGGGSLARRIALVDEGAGVEVQVEEGAGEEGEAHPGHVNGAGVEGEGGEGGVAQPHRLHRGGRQLLLWLSG